MKKSTVLRSVMLAATVAAIGAMSLVGSADTVPAEEEKVFDKVATFEIGADSNGTVVDVEVTGDVINIEPGIISLDGELYMSEAVSGNADVFKLRVLSEDENGEIQANDIETIDNGNGYFYYKWDNKF